MKIAGRGIRKRRIKGKSKIRSQKTVYDGILFDSLTESRYYEYLKNQPSVKNIELQPEYTLLETFKIRCSRCKGIGSTPSLKTNKQLKCRICDGTGQRSRQDWTYKPDFKVTYLDGYEEVIDVKGYANERFSLVKKMWENKYGQELVVIKDDKKGGWKRS